MSKHLHNQNRIPYGGAYVLNLPEKAMVGHGTNWGMLLKSIAEWRRANSVPVGLGFEAEVEQVICEKYPAECDDDSMPQSRRRDARLTLSTILRGTKVILAFKLAGSPYVEQAEAERRAAICSACVNNQDFKQPCGGGCASLKAMLASIIGNRQTPYDYQLKACSICGCQGKSHIWFPLDILAKGVTSDMKVQFAAVKNCWKQT